MCNSYFCATSKIWRFTRMYITFLHITQKELTKDIFHCLELITEILSFLQIFSVRKTTTSLLIFQKLFQGITEKTRFLTYFGSLKASYR